MSQDTVRIRDATPEDAPVIADIYNESIAAGDATMDDDPKTPEYFRQLMAGFNKREAILVMEVEGKVIGWGIIKRYSDRSGYRFCCETSVYLYRSQVGKGYGTRLKKALIERCREYGYHHLVAKIFADNRASIEYNRKLGYEMVGIQKEIGFKNGHWQDIAIMQLVLKDVPPEIPEKYR
ncbi:MAG: N-acetyltransferase family protein [Calditrichaeota bacterium]|nr:MAG: N-acetyltransferase family protein [Calditrichota bacterium]